MSSAFDEYSEKYDEWFMKNEKVLLSEALLVESMLKDEKGKILSVGCGSGLFEKILRDKGVVIEDCVEPSEMGRIAEKRGLKVKIGYAENLPVSNESYDVILFNGVIHYLKDKRKALNELHRVLRNDGHLILCWVPGESSYGLLYRLASLLGWEKLSNVSPEYPYPLEFVKEGSWPTYDEVKELLESSNFKIIKTMQTLTKHPKYSNIDVETPLPGYEKGDYVCIKAKKESGSLKS